MNVSEELKNILEVTTIIEVNHDIMNFRIERGQSISISFKKKEDKEGGK